MFAILISSYYFLLRKYNSCFSSPLFLNLAVFYCINPCRRFSLKTLLKWFWKKVCHICYFYWRNTLEVEIKITDFVGISQEVFYHTFRISFSFPFLWLGKHFLCWIPIFARNFVNILLMLTEWFKIIVSFTNINTKYVCILLLTSIKDLRNLYGAGSGQTNWDGSGSGSYPNSLKTGTGIGTILYTMLTYVFNNEKFNPIC
jgi:hypothetical protein